jgi:hypothetical protein
MTMIDIESPREMTDNELDSVAGGTPTLASVLADPSNGSVLGACMMTLLNDAQQNQKAARRESRAAGIL